MLEDFNEQSADETIEIDDDVLAQIRAAARAADAQDSDPVLPDDATISLSDGELEDIRNRAIAARGDTVQPIRLDASSPQTTIRPPTVPPELPQPAGSTLPETNSETSDRWIVTRPPVEEPRPPAKPTTNSTPQPIVPQPPHLGPSVVGQTPTSGLPPVSSNEPWKPSREAVSNAAVAAPPVRRSTTRSTTSLLLLVSCLFSLILAIALAVIVLQGDDDVSEVPATPETQPVDGGLGGVDG